MAAGYLPAPGTKYGPCSRHGGCGHIDCNETRVMAATPCRICNEPISYDRSFYHEGDQRVRPFVLSHADCAEIEANKCTTENCTLESTTWRGDVRYCRGCAGRYDIRFGERAAP